MKYRLTIFFWCFLGCFTAVYPQQITFQTYTVYDGLVANPVTCIYQDSKGFIWIGTYDGVSRYDGYKFTNLTAGNGLSHNLINSIFEVNGKVLVCENNGAIDIFENNIFVKRLMAKSAANFISLKNNRVLITSDADGFYEYKNDTIISVIQQKATSSLGKFILINDTVLLTDGVDSELFLYDKDFKILNSLENLIIHFYSFLRDSKNRIFTCTTDGLKLLSIKPGEKEAISFIQLPPEFNFEPINNAAVTSMIEEADGSYWFGTLKGLVHLLPNGNFHIYNEKDGLPSARIQDLYLDKEKNLWIGTSLGLVKWVSKNSVLYFNTEAQDFRNDLVSVTSSNDQKIILKTDHGLQDFDFRTRKFTNIKVPNDLYPIPVSGTSPLLIQYANYIGALNPQKNLVSPVSKLDTIVPGTISALMHPNGTIFIASFSGLYAIQKSLVKRIMPERVTTIALDSNSALWVGTWDHGLFQINLSITDPDLYNIHNMTDMVKDTMIRGLYVDSKKNIWVGSRYSGAFCFTPRGIGKFNIKHFNRQSGLMSDWVITFAETKSGDIWVGTYLGLDKLVKEPPGYRIFNFSKAVNFFAEIKKIIPYYDHWICVANTGIAIFKDESLHQATPLQTFIFSTSLGVHENKITIFSPTKKIILKPFQNAATFQFGALGFINERQISYSYRLLGSSDTNWSKPANIHEASYASLSPGTYTFEVRSLGWNGQFGKPAVFSFVIATPFWKQWWFIALCAVAVAAMVYTLYRYRIKQIMRLQKVRNTIATDLHDDIGSALTNISILAELSRNKNQQNVFAENLPSRISEESTLAQQALDDIIWSVNSNNDNLNQTMARMRRYAGEVFEPIGINCIIDFESIPGDHKLNMEQRKDIYLVFKECLNNIIKHAAAKNVFIKLDLEKNLFNLKIEDDGKGFDPLKQTDRNGVKNIRERVERWNGKLTIHSSTGKGTTVDCSFPLASPK